MRWRPTTPRCSVGQLEDKLSKVSYDATGVNGTPTLKIDGANLQIVSGSGSTNGTVNGVGNLFIGYDEQQEDQQTGSHNLILGMYHTFTSFGGLLAGVNNTITGAFSSVSGGANSTASGDSSSVSGGGYNEATDDFSAVSGGISNTASGRSSSVSGGSSNTARGNSASVSGGAGNMASAVASSILGGSGHVVSSAYGTSL